MEKRFHKVFCKNSVIENPVSPNNKMLFSIHQTLNMTKKSRNRDIERGINRKEKIRLSRLLEEISQK